jgi:carbon-monoxide dehydrogenase small subunit
LPSVALTVNGEPVVAEVEDRLLLSDFLRSTLRLTGTRVGCEHGVCGACTVLLDGAAVRSCLLLAAQVDGTAVTTIEGVADGEHLHPVQEALCAEHALQCGFCTSGLVLSVIDLLAATPEPDEAEIREQLGGSVCRCTGYQQVVGAVQRAAATIREGDGR